MKATAFFHIATIGAYQAITDELMDCVMGSGLINHLEALNCCVSGSGDVRLATHPKVHQMRLRADSDKFEFPTLQRLHAHAKSHPGEAVLYFHTKGVSKAGNPCISDWRQYMAYFVLEQWGDALDALECTDTAGVDWSVFHIDTMSCTSESITYFGRDLHYSGNFWWAHTDYIARLPDLDDTKGRHSCEMWIGKIKGNHRCLWTSGIPILARQYFRYGRSVYAQKEGVSNA